jgi:Fe-S oxidoreductase
MLDAVSCTECGRCQDVCPAFQTGKELSPKLLIMGLRDQLFAEGPSLLEAARGGAAFTATPLVPNAVSDEVVWDCVTCGACVYECPVSIEHVDHIIDLRRDLVMVASRFPAEAGTMLRDVERSANPWGKPQTERADCARGGLRSAGGAVLGRLRAGVRRAGPRGRALDRQAAAGGRRRLRHPRSA